MVREIEFKGLSEETSEWLFGNLVKIGNYYYILSQKEKEEPLNLNRVFEDSIREFTGFYNMDNNKIFEGNIIEDLYYGYPILIEVAWDTIDTLFKFKILQAEFNIETDVMKKVFEQPKEFNLI